jgi:putative methionine-R-sulfoxide reductase with GAF domain
VSTLTATIDARDQYREDHQRRVAADAVALGERLQFDVDVLRDLRYASIFHSIGKIAIPGVILAKRGPADAGRARDREEHPILGARILESIRFSAASSRSCALAASGGMARAIPRSSRAMPSRARRAHCASSSTITRCSSTGHIAWRCGRRPRWRSCAGWQGTWYDPAIVDEFTTMIEARGTIQAVEEEVGQTSAELAILAELTPEFHTILDLQQLLDRILAILERNNPGASFTILLRDEKTDDLVVRAAAGSWTAIDSPMRVQAGRGIASWVIEHREAQNIEDVRKDPRYVGDPSVRSELVVPLVSGGTAIGVLALSHKTVAAFAQRDLMLMQTIGAQIAAAIDVAGLHERLKRAANTDALTGLHNYRYFYDRLEEEVARAERRLRSAGRRVLRPRQAEERERHVRPPSGATRSCASLGSRSAITCAPRMCRPAMAATSSPSSCRTRRATKPRRSSSASSRCSTARWWICRAAAGRSRCPTSRGASHLSARRAERHETWSTTRTRGPTRGSDPASELRARRLTTAGSLRTGSCGR